MTTPNSKKLIENEKLQDLKDLKNEVTKLRELNVMYQCTIERKNIMIEEMQKNIHKLSSENVALRESKSQTDHLIKDQLNSAQNLSIKLNEMSIDLENFNETSKKMTQICSSFEQKKNEMLAMLQSNTSDLVRIFVTRLPMLRSAIFMSF